MRIAKTTGLRILIVVIFSGVILLIAGLSSGGRGVDAGQVADELIKDERFVSRFGAEAVIDWDPSSRSVSRPSGGGDVTGYYNYRVRGNGVSSKVKVYWGSNGSVYLREWSE